MIYRYLFELFTQTIPELIAFTFTATVLLKTKLDIKLVILIGFISGTLLYILRKSPLTFGFHSIISLFLLTIMLKHFFQKNSLDCFITVLKTFVILTFIELLNFYTVTHLTNINQEIIKKSTEIKTLVMLPNIILLLLIGIIIHRYYKRS